MNIEFTFSGIYVGLITANENVHGCEIIGAECVTCSNDLTKRARMRPEIENKMVDIRLEFKDIDDDGDIYNDRHQMLYYFVHLLAEQGIVFDQFIITCCPLPDGRHAYHILASIFNEGGCNVDVRSLNDDCEAVGKLFSELEELCDRTVHVTGKVPNMRMSFSDVVIHANRYNGSNPLCHELVLPYRDTILSRLAKSVFRTE